MEAEVRRYRDAFEQAGSGMALLSADGAWVEANPAMARLLGQPVATLVGTRAHATLFGPTILDTIAAVGEAGAVDPIAFEAPDVDGKRHWRVTLARLPADGGSAARVLLQLDDIGVEYALRAAREQWARQQDLLAYGISHDLRAPLRSIAGFAARLDASGLAADAEAASDLARIRAAAARAEHLIDELLELSRASHQPYREEVVDLSLLGEWVAAELRDAEPSREASIDVPPDLFARGDEHWLRCLLQKLFGNAWKFSATRDRVEIAMHGAVSAGTLEIAIRDHGCGFDMRYADKLFLPFQKLHGPDQGGGNGLGLAIAHRIVERHGGRIWARSQPGEGSTFFIELPAATKP